MLPKIMEPDHVQVQTSSNTALDELNALRLLEQDGFNLAEYRLIDYTELDDGTYRWTLEKDVNK